MPDGLTTGPAISRLLRSRRQNRSIGEGAFDSKRMVHSVFFANSSYLHVGWVVSPSLKRLDTRIHVDDDAFGRVSVNGNHLRTGRRGARSRNQLPAVRFDDLPGLR